MSLKEPRATYDGFQTLERGVDSAKAPSLIGLDQSAFHINAHTRSGFVQNRPGWAKVLLTGDDFQLGRWQTASSYISSGGSPYLVASIGGRIVRFDPINRSVLNLSPDTSPELINPGNLPRAWFVQAETFLCIQDNSSIPLVFNGTGLRRARPIAFGGDEFPVGNVMEYNNGRLWVALPDRRTFVGGDLAYSVTGEASDVLKSTQNKFLTSGSFALPANAGFITSMRSLANQDSTLGQGPLIVFGQFGAGTVNAPFNAEEWQNTNSPIVSVGLLSVGPSGQDTCVSVNGDLWYRAPDGIRTFMIARRDHGTWVNTPVSHEMERVFRYDDPYLLDMTSAVNFDNRLLTTCSPFRATYGGVEYGVAFRGLSVLDFTRVASMFDRTQPTWEGLWNGISILQILTVNCYGKDRCFMFVLNECHEIELWEQSLEDNYDNMVDPIDWTIETRSMGFEDKAEFLKELVRTEVWPRYLRGVVGYTVKFRPDDYPFWLDLDGTTFCASTGICNAPGCTLPAGPYPQYRNRKISSAPNDECEPCNDKKFKLGFEFQFQISMSGPGRIRRFRAVASDVPESVANGCLSDQAEECCEQSGCSDDPWQYETPNEC